MNVVPYVFEECKLPKVHGVDSDLKSYLVTLYFMFDGKQTYTFAHQHDLLDNYGLALDFGVYCTVFTKRIIVNRLQHSRIFYEIQDYVSKSNYD